MLGSKIGSVCDSHIVQCDIDRNQGTFLDEVENALELITGVLIAETVRKCPRLDSITIQEEVKQSIIDRCVNVDINRRATIGKLPFVANPDLRLEPNEHLELKIYKGQVRKLENRPTGKLAVIQSENKLQKLGFVDYSENLSKGEKELIMGKLQNDIPWRTIWNEKSLSIPCRIVFDTSHSKKQESF